MSKTTDIGHPNVHGRWLTALEYKVELYYIPIMKEIYTFVNSVVTIDNKKSS